MKTTMYFLIVALCILSSEAFLVKSPLQKTESLVEQDGELNPNIARKQWADKQHNLRVQMLARESPSPELKLKKYREEEPGCIACYGSQIIYGKYFNADGDSTDNSYYLFKDPATKDSGVYLPIIVQFHAGGFYTGAPWQKENTEIKGYLSAGFAVVSAGYRLAPEKYFYEADDGTNKTEELIHVSKEGKLSLDKNGKTMDDYKVRVGKQEFITKYLYDATQVIEHLIKHADKLGLDTGRIVFLGESSGGAAMQYLTWVYHQWNEDRYTPRGIVYHNAQLNYPVTNMLGETWNLFSETMGPQVKLADVVSADACPTIVGNHMCGSLLGNASDYNLCNADWNERSLREFCGEALNAATLGQARARQVWPDDDEEAEGFEKLWYTSENMQKHMPSDPFYIYVANSMNGTGALDVAHHSIYALNFAKYAEMGKHGGHQYTVYYTDFAHMTEADRGMERVEVLREVPSLAVSPAAAPAGFSGPLPRFVYPGPAPAAALAPAPAPSFAVAVPTVFNYLSTHGWREDVAEARDIEAGSMEERVLYASLAVGIGPFREIANITSNETRSGAPRKSTLGVTASMVALMALLSHSIN